MAAASTKIPITEHTSRLLSQVIFVSSKVTLKKYITTIWSIIYLKVMIMDPTGTARRPPPSVIECLQALNKSLRLGYLLCRQPALLLDIIGRQGTQKAMPWLQDLLHNSEHSLKYKLSSSYYNCVPIV